MASQPLSERDVNVNPASTSPSKDQIKSNGQHGQILDPFMKDDRRVQTYISPSDNILSPASQKLAAFKNKRNERSTKPRSLFAKTMERNANAATRSAEFADIQPSDQPSNDGKSDSQ